MAETPDTLTGMAHLLTDLQTRLELDQVQALANRTGMSESDVRKLFNRANTITKTSHNHEITRSALERLIDEPDMYTLEGDRTALISVEDTSRPGRGFDIQIRDTGHGPAISIWMMNDADIPGANQGFVPLEPIAIHTYAYNDYLHDHQEDTHA